MGFTINLSLDSLEMVDAMWSHRGRVAPLTVVVPSESPQVLTTPGGNKVTVCPAQTLEGMTCAECGACAKPDRKTVIGFRAHGQSKYIVNELVRMKRKVA